jgi:glycerophosphoryl diester phosphodiesterase
LTLDAAFLLFGHRGAAGLEPENTLRSFVRAAEVGADGVELDVRLKEGRLLVCHDDTVNRCTNGSGPLSSLELEQIRNLDAGKGEKIPFLEEVFTTLPESLFINIEIKHTQEIEKTTAAVAEVIANFPRVQVLVSSFQHEALECFREHNKMTRVAPLFQKNTNDMLDIAKSLKAWSLNISRKIISTELVEKIHEAGYKTYVYTVNKPQEASRLIDWGVDGLITDFPDRLINNLR